MNLGSLLSSSLSKNRNKKFLISVEGTYQSYDEVGEQWGIISNFLLEKADGNKSLVGILSKNKTHSIYAIGGVLMSGNAYVPLDGHAPVGRNINIIRESKLNGLLILHSELELYAAYFEGFSISRVAEFIYIDFEESATIVPDQLAFILYTSGSTGTPKGVMISHENAYAFMDWATDTYGLTSTDVLGSIAPFHFDLSVFDLYGSIKVGASMLLIEPSVASNPRLLTMYLESNKVTVLYTTPSLLQAMANYGKMEKKDFKSLRTIFFAGEVFPIDAFMNFRSLLPDVNYINFYGPTETNVCTYHQVGADMDGNTPLPIGHLCPYAGGRIKEGEKGELLISGKTVAMGYWLKPDITATRFFSDEKGVRWYRTGDIVSLSTDGYQFHGRNDRMIKRRGYRIELDEIQHQVSMVDAVTENAVFLNDNHSEVKIICIFVSSLKDDIVSKIRLKLSETLPLYMMPDVFKSIDAIPRTSTGKVDYQSLPELIN